MLQRSKSVHRLWLQSQLLPTTRTSCKQSLFVCCHYIIEHCLCGLHSTYRRALCSKERIYEIYSTVFINRAKWLYNMNDTWLTFNSQPFVKQIKVLKLLFLLSGNHPIRLCFIARIHFTRSLFSAFATDCMIVLSLRNSEHESVIAPFVWLFNQTYRKTWVHK